MIEANTLNGSKKFIEGLKALNELGINDISEYKQLLEQEIQNNQKSFTFKCCKYFFKGMYASTSFNLLDKPQEDYGNSVLDCVFCHVIPQQTYSLIIVGYQNNHKNSLIEQYVDSWGQLDNSQLGVQLTDLALRCDSWGMSVSWFNNISEIKQNEFMEIQKNYILSPQTTMSQTQFNMFDGVLN